MNRRRGLLLVLIAGLLAACTQGGVAPGPMPTPSPEPTPGPTPGQPEPYAVTGVAVDTQGRPLAGAKVWIDAAYEGVAEVYTGADGRYLVTDLPRGPFYAKAWTEVDYNGQLFCLRLGMPNPRDYDSFTAEAGVVRDFQWQLSGVIEDLKEYDGYFGGDVRLFEYGSFESGVVELTFTPRRPLLTVALGKC